MPFPRPEEIWEDAKRKVDLGVRGSIIETVEYDTLDKAKKQIYSWRSDLEHAGYTFIKHEDARSPEYFPLGGDVFISAANVAYLFVHKSGGAPGVPETFTVHLHIASPEESLKKPWR